MMAECRWQRQNDAPCRNRRQTGATKPRNAAVSPVAIGAGQDLRTAIAAEIGQTFRRLMAQAIPFASCRRTAVKPAPPGKHDEAPGAPGGAACKGALSLEVGVGSGDWDYLTVT